MQQPLALFASCVAVVIVVAVTSLHAADAPNPPPAKQGAKAEQPAQVSEPRTQMLKGFTFLSSQTKTKMSDLGEKVQTMIPALKKAIADSHAKVAGSIIFIYHGATEDPNTEFDLEVGCPIEEKVTPPDGFKVREVEPYKCMSVLYTGSLNQFDKAYEKLMPAVVKSGAERTGESREMYIYFESPESENNVVLVSVGIK